MFRVSVSLVPGSCIDALLRGVLGTVPKLELDVNQFKFRQFLLRHIHLMIMCATIDLILYSTSRSSRSIMQMVKLHAQRHRSLEIADVRMTILRGQLAIIQFGGYYELRAQRHRGLEMK